MKFFGLLILTLLTGVLSTDWYVCFIKKQCSVNNKVEIIQQAQAVTQPSVPVEPVVKTVKKKAAEDKVEIINGRIHFKYGAKNFLSSQKVQKYLKQVADQWSQDKKKRVAVSGHTDSRGSRRSNYRLGLKRSKSIKRFRN